MADPGQHGSTAKPVQQQAAGVNGAPGGRVLSGRTGSGIPRGPAPPMRPPEADDGSRSLRPTEIYAAAKAELHGPAALISLSARARMGGTPEMPSSPRRGVSNPGAPGRSGQPLTPSSPSRGGGLGSCSPFAPASPSSGGGAGAGGVIPLRAPSFRNRDRDSNSSILALAEEQRYMAGFSTMQHGSPIIPPASRKTVSAPDSQSQQLMAFGQPWSNQLQQQQQVDLPHMPTMEATGFDSPRLHQQQLAQRLIGISGQGSPSTASPADSSSPPTPSNGAMRPRPPGDTPGHRRRPSKESHLSFNLRAESSKDTSSSTGSPALDPRSPSLAGYDIASPRFQPNGSGGSRVASARNRGIQTLFDAIRSKSDAKLQDALEGFRQNGAYAGLDEKHLIYGRTALHEAVAMNNIPMAKILLKAGANPNVANDKAGPPLLHAAQHGEVGMVELLLSFGADISARDVSGSTPLHGACAAGHSGAARVLLAHGASLQDRNEDGERPLELVTEDAVREELLAAAAAAAAAGVGPSSAPGSRQPSGGGMPGAGYYVPPASPPRLVSRLKGAVGSGSMVSSPGRLQLASNLPAGLPRSPKAGQQRPAAAASAGGAHQQPQLASAVSAGSSFAGGGGSDRPLSQMGGSRLSSARSAGGAAATAGAAGAAAPLRGEPPGPSETLMGLAKARLALQTRAGESPRNSEASTPASNLDSADQEYKRSLSPPPQLELPNRVFRRESSRGAGASDITHAFEEQDAEVLARQQSAMTLIFGAPGQAGQAQQAQQAQQAAQQQQQLQAQRSAALAAAVPITPKFRFGVDIMENPPGMAMAAMAGASQLRQQSAPPAAAPMPAPEELGSTGSAIGECIPAVPSGTTGGTGGTSVTVPPPRPSASSQDDLGPPLVRDASPVQSRGPSDSGAGPGPGSGGHSGGGGGAGSGRVPGTPRTPRNRGPPPGGDATSPHGVQDVLRISQAAQALVARIGGLMTSTEALHAHAIAMFKRSAEVQTGSIAWTKGELLGEGAFGKVYAGLNQMTGELMAVKALDLLGRKGHNMHAQLEELQQELNLYKHLSHKHIVAYIDSQFDERTSTLYIFLEYVPGGSIASMLKRFGKFNEELVRNYTRQLLLGLEYLHNKRIVHRDVKGGNVLVTRDGIIKLADFGASKVNQAGTITDGLKSLRGSVFWMAPEVIQQVGYGRRADIWSLGCTVIEMLTGKHPWPDIDNQLSAMFQIVQRTSGPPRPEHCSDLALDFLDQCFKHNANERPTATELLQHPFVCTPELARRFDSSGGKDLKQSI